MYAAVSLKRLTAIIVTPFTIALFILLILRDAPLSGTEFYNVAKNALVYSSGFLLIFFGPTGRYAPWRAVWRACPFLNRLAFPDLNGVWIGTTSSNWPSVRTMLDAAEGSGGIRLADLSTIALQDDDVTMTIKASLFSLRISATLHRTGSSSHSLTERVSVDKRRDVQELYYVYRQDTPQPESTDDDSHLGAAMLTIDTDAWTLFGAYWTKRTWRSGLNTAGLIRVRRKSR